MEQDMAIADIEIEDQEEITLVKDMEYLNQV